MAATQIAADLFSAFERGDGAAVTALCTADFTGSQNGGPAMDLATLLQFSALVKRRVPDLHYANCIRSATATGFVEEHDVVGTLPDGTALNLPVCVVAELTGGRVRRLREYFDSAAAAALIAALA